MSRFSKRHKSPLPRVGGHNDPADEVRANLSIDAVSARTVETSVTKTRKKLSIDTSFDDGARIAKSSSARSERPTRSQSPNISTTQDVSSKMNTPMQITGVNRKVALTPGQQMLLKQLQIQKVQESQYQRKQSIIEKDAIAASVTNSYGKLPLSRPPRSSQGSPHSVRRSVHIDTTDSSKNSSTTRDLHAETKRHADEEQAAMELIAKRRASMPGFQTVSSLASPAPPGPPRGPHPDDEPKEKAYTPKIVLNVRKTDAPIEEKKVSAKFPQPIVYSVPARHMYSSTSARWLQLSASLWSVLLMDSRRNTPNSRIDADIATKGIIDTHSMRQLLQVMKMRQVGNVSDAEMCSILEAWGLDDISNGAAKDQRHLFSVYHCRRLLWEQQYTEADIAMFIGLVVNVMSSKAEISENPSPSKNLLRPASWHRAVEQLFFLFDSHGHGLWTFDEVFTFGAALVVGFSGDHDVKDSKASNGTRGRTTGSSDSGEWTSRDDAFPDLQLGVLSAYAVKLLELMQACVPIETADVDPWIAKKSNMGARYAKYKQTSGASSDGFLWGSAPDMTLALTLIGPGSPITSTDALTDEILPSVEYEADVSEESPQVKSSATASAMARRGSILGSRNRGTEEEKSTTQEGSHEKTRKSPARYGRFFITLPMLKAFLLSTGSKSANEAQVQRLIDHSKTFIRRVNKWMRSGGDGGLGNKGKVSEENRGVSTHLFHNAIERAVHTSNKLGKTRHTELLAKFLDSDGYKYIPAKWRAKKGHKVDKADDHVVARRLVVMYQRWMGSFDGTKAKSSRKESATSYFDEADSDEDSSTGPLTSKELNRVHYNFVVNVLDFYRAHQNQLCDSLLEVAVKYYIPEQPSNKGSSTLPGALSKKSKSKLINIACATLLPDIEAMLYTLDVVNDDDEEQIEAELKRKEIEENELAKKKELEAQRANEKRFTIPVPASRIHSKKGSPGNSPDVHSSTDELGLANPPLHSEDSLGLFGPPPTKGILKKPVLPEKELELAGPPDSDGWAAVSGIGASPPKKHSPAASVRSNRSRSHSRTDSVDANSGEKESEKTAPAFKTWYRVTFHAGTFIRNVPSRDAVSLGDIDFDDIVEVTGNIHKEDGGLAYMELAHNRGWVPLMSKAGATVFEPLSRPPTPSNDVDKVAVPVAVPFTGSAPRSRASSINTDAGPGGSAKSGTTTGSTGPKKKSVLHFFQKAVGLKAHNKPEQENDQQEKNDSNSVNYNDEQDREDSESDVREDDGTRSEDSDFDQLDELDAELDDEHASTHDEDRRLHQEHMDNLGVKEEEHAREHTEPKSKNKTISAEEHSLLDALVTADDPKDQAYLISRLKEVRTATKAPQPQQGDRERFVSPRTDYLRGFFSSISDEKNQHGVDTPNGIAHTSQSLAPHRAAPVYLDVSEAGTDDGSEAISQDQYPQNYHAQGEYHGRRRSETPLSEATSTSNAGSIAELLSQGQSAGRYAQTLRHILREMSQPASNGMVTPAAGGSLQMQHLEEVLRLGQAIATQEKKQAEVLREEKQNREMHPPSRSRTPTGRPPLAGSGRSESARRTGGKPPEVTYTEDPYAFSNRTPRNHEQRQGLPYSGRARKPMSSSRRDNTHQAFSGSPEENALRAKIRTLELQERRIDREERTVGGSSRRRGTYFGARSASADGRDIRETGSRVGNDNDLGGGRLFQDDSYHQSTPARAYAGRVVRGSAAVPGSVQRLGNRAVPGQAPSRSTTKQPKMAFGNRY